jgi:hypothetical protein
MPDATAGRTCAAMSKRIRTPLFLVLLLVTSGAAFVAGRSSRPAAAGGAGAAATPLSAGAVYTCSMHPQVRRAENAPGADCVPRRDHPAAAAPHSGHRSGVARRS